MQKEVSCLLSAWPTLYVMRPMRSHQEKVTPTVHAHTEVLGSVFSHRKAQGANMPCQGHCFSISAGCTVGPTWAQADERPDCLRSPQVLSLATAQHASGPPPASEWASAQDKGEQSGTFREKCAFHAPSHPHRVMLTLGRDIKNRGLGPRPCVYSPEPTYPQPGLRPRAQPGIPLPTSRAASAPKWCNGLSQ